MGTDDVERAIQRLADCAASLTLDQRLRIAALLARPAEPESPPPSRAASSSRAPPESLVLTVEEAAELLKVGRTTVYELVRTGRLKSISIGRLRRIRHTEVADYLDRVDQGNTAGVSTRSTT